MLERGMARLDGFVVMPDHLHFIFELGEGHELSAVLREFKKYTALNANRAMGRTSAFWQDGYYEHAIRTSEEWTVRMDYMLGNPVRAGLAERVGEYRWARYGPWEANGSRGQRPLPQSD
jgi:REP element-mobilizing transposase RayT